MIEVYFGNPGSGKTTQAVKDALRVMRKVRRKTKFGYKHAFCNFPQTAHGVVSCNFDGIGEWTFPANSYVALDEAGIEFNNRAYKTLPKAAIKWFKLHRHYRVDVAVFSQSWEDMDVTIRRLADRLWHMRKIGPWTLCRRVYKYTMVDENTHQIIDGYRMASFLWLLVFPLQWLGLTSVNFKLTFRPFYYKYFNTYDRPGTPVKSFWV